MTQMAFDLQPADVASWLSAQGWSALPAKSRTARLWRRGESEVLQPLIPEASDYLLRWFDMLASLSREEGRNPESLANEMLYEGADVCEWRASHKFAIDHTIPLADGERLIRSAREAFVAAASATIQRRAYFGHSITRAARDHANAVRMGQTQSGSYVVPIISRVPGATVPVEEDQRRFDLDVAPQPFERRVMLQLADSLSAVRMLLDERRADFSVSRLNDTVGLGVSHELCGALVGSLTAGAVSELRMTFGWARRAPVSNGTGTVEFSREDAAPIGRMATLLRGSDVVADQTVYGFIRGLRRDRDEPNGTVTMRAAIGPEQRLVRMDLGPELYDLAGTAHAQRRLVSVFGRLVREAGRTWHFSEVRDLALMEPMSEHNIEPH